MRLFSTKKSYIPGDDTVIGTEKVTQQCSLYNKNEDTEIELETEKYEDTNVEIEENPPLKRVIYWEMTLLLILKRRRRKLTKLLLLRFQISKNMIKFLIMTLYLLTDH